MAPDDVLAAARAWRDDDPDEADRAELDSLLAAAAQGSPRELDELRDRFSGRLEFGTAGLRGPMGAGPNRMNRAVVIRTTAGLAAWLTEHRHRGRPVVVGHDARHRSERLAADAAAVLAAAGFPVLLGDRPLPTPVVAFGVRHAEACAGVVVTASHNPPGDNGYKVYLDDGAQIAPPIDAEISAQIDAVGPVSSVARVPDRDPMISPVADSLVDAYVAGAVKAALRPGGEGGEPPARDVQVVYTPLHGVAREVVEAAFDAAGFPPVAVVPEQADPDPEFPTVPFPNPEEPGALDLAVSLARQQSAHVVVANDPDGDRLAVAVPVATDTTGGPWRALSGDEIGILLADWLLSAGSGADRLVVTTVVSSSMLGRLAEARGVAFAETLTGFKWIARAGMARPDLRFVYGYEEALGSCVGTYVRDKDGITAALAFAELVAEERRRGRNVLERLDDLARELGVHATGQRSIPVGAGPGGADQVRGVIDRLASHPPAALAGRPVTSVEDLRRGERLPPADGVVLRGEGVRLVVRPSGTEPKLKCYAEAVVDVVDDDVRAARREGDMTVATLLDEAAALVGPLS